MKRLITLMVLIMISTNSFANVHKCKNCSAAEKLIEDIQSKQIKCEALNAKTAPQQELFASKATQVVNLILNEPSFSVEHAEAIIKLSSQVAPYDVAMALPQDIGIERFKKHLSTFQLASKNLRDNGSLDKVLNDQIFEYLGLISSRDRLNTIKCPIK